jgi:hypothetical protein
LQKRLLRLRVSPDFCAVKHYFQTANYLSLPIVVGAILSQRMAARLADAVDPVHWATPMVLGLAVWIVYTIDRLLDVQKPAMPNTGRHWFHRQHQRVLWQVVTGAAALGALLLFWLPGPVVRFGFALAALCAGYVLAVWRLRARHPALLLKEPLVALLYAVGIWGSVWAQHGPPGVSSIEIAEAVLFGAVAFQNLLLFSVFEQLTPNPPDFSIATAWGVSRCDQVLRLITLFVVTGAFGVCFFVDDFGVLPGGGPRFAQRAALMIGIMSLTLYTIQRYPAWFLHRNRYRFLGDAVFWFPALVL